jgi:hypothetical protein
VPPELVVLLDVYEGLLAGPGKRPAQIVIAARDIGEDAAREPPR